MSYYYKYRYVKTAQQDRILKESNRVIFFESGTGYQMHITGLMMSLTNPSNGQPKPTIICLDRSGFLYGPTKGLLNCHSLSTKSFELVQPQRINVISDPSLAQLAAWLAPQIQKLNAISHVHLILDCAYLLPDASLQKLLSLRCNVHLYTSARSLRKYDNVRFDKRLHLQHASRQTGAKPS